MRIALSVLFAFTLHNGIAQSDIPVGTWRAHLSYNNIQHVAVTPSFVYAASDIAILVYDRNDRSLSSINKLNGLTSSGISAIGYAETNNLLIIGYEDGNIDFVTDASIENFPRLKELTNITGSRRINHIAANDNEIYFATDFGVVIYDQSSSEIKETWRDLGPAGEKLAIYDIEFFSDSVALATTSGILRGGMADNLLDFTKWNRYDDTPVSDTVSHIEIFNDQLYAVVPETGAFVKTAAGFAPVPQLGTQINSIEHSSNHIIVATTNDVRIMSADGSWNTVDYTSGSDPRHAVEEQGGIYWIGDAQSGLSSNVNGSFEVFKPNGPSFKQAFRLRYADKKIFAVQGGYSDTREPKGLSGSYDVFEDGIWTTVNTTVNDITDILTLNNNRYIATFGAGLLVTDQENNQVSLFDAANSSLVDAHPPEPSVQITGMTLGSRLLVLNYDVTPSLHDFSTGSGTAITVASFEAMFGLRIATDDFGSAWIAVDPRAGGGIVVKRLTTGEEFYLTDSPLAGELPHRNVHVITKDRDGLMWVGTQAGIAYFFSETETAVRPIFENRFLLRDEKITAIAVDGGDRKWIGTERGVWLFNPTGDQLIYNFNVANSPLISNRISDIAINDISGEVFFATDDGIVSFRSNSTSDEGDQSIRIFPNPVTRNFGGMIAMSAVPMDAVIKITDVTGRLIAQVQANGNTATWNGLDFKGRRPATGVYLVFASLPDGSQDMVGKIAIVD